MAIVALAALSATGFVLGWKRVETARAELAVDERQLDFGEAWSEDRFQWPLTVKNVGQDSVEVLNIRASCQCTEVFPRRFQLRPQEEKTLRLSFNLTGAPEEQVFGPNRELGVELVPEVRGAPPGQFRWQVRGKVRNLLSVSPPSPTATIIRSLPLPEVDLSVTCHRPLGNLAADCSPPVASASVVRDTEDASRHDVRVRLDDDIVKDDFPDGEFSLTVNLRPFDSTGTPLPSIPVLVRVRAVQGIAVSPERVIFGSVPLGGTDTESVSIVSRSDKNFEVIHVESSEGLVVDPQSPPDPAGPCTYRVSQTAIGSGIQRGHVLFHVKESDGHLSDLIVPVMYYGVSTVQRPPPE